MLVSNSLASTRRRRVVVVAAGRWMDPPGSSPRQREPDARSTARARSCHAGRQGAEPSSGPLPRRPALRRRRRRRRRDPRHKRVVARASAVALAGLSGVG